MNGMRRFRRGSDTMQEKARKIVMNYFNNHVDVTDGKDQEVVYEIP